VLRQTSSITPALSRGNAPEPPRHPGLGPRQGADPPPSPRPWATAIGSNQLRHPGPEPGSRCSSAHQEAGPRLKAGVTRITATASCTEHVPGGEYRARRQTAGIPVIADTWSKLAQARTTPSSRPRTAAMGRTSPATPAPSCGD